MSQTAKTSALIILTGLSIASGIFSCITVKCLVAKFGNSTRFKRTISVLNCLAGGVFFATCILDILPEGRAKMEEAKVHWGWDTEYPFSEVLVGIGFLLILALEQGARTVHQYNYEKTRIIDKKPDISETASRGVKSSVRFSKANQKPIDVVGKQDSIIVGDFEDSSCFDDVSYRTYGAIDVSLDKTAASPYNFTPEPKVSPDIEIMFENSDKIVIKRESAIPNSPEHITAAEALSSLVDTKDDKQHSMRGIILLAALSLHMIFDGLSLGLLQSTSKIWNLVLALSLHKMLLFYKIGLQIYELLKSLPKAIAAICLFALISPTGIIIGENISSNGDESVQQSAAAILQGLAAGTFIYVTLFEILQREFVDSVHDTCKVLVTVIGFSLIGVLRLLENED